MTFYGDWQEQLDEASNATYYYNANTGETSWALSEDVLALGPTGGEDAGDGDGEEVAEYSGPGPLDWVEEHTEDGEVYYSNSVTGETSWEKPEGWDEAIAAQDQFSAGGDDDAESYYEDPNENPHLWSPYPGDGEEEGMFYYYNEETGETTWDKPECVTLHEEKLARKAAKEAAEKAAAEEEEKNAKDEEKDSESGSEATTESLEGADYERDFEEEDALSLIDKLTDPQATVDQLMKYVEDYSLDQFAERSYNYERKGLLRSRTAIDKLLAWKMDALKVSLIMHEDHEVAAAGVHAFTHVLSYMTDKPSVHSPTDHATAIIKLLFRDPNVNDELTDEVLAQICKQTTNNPSPSNNDRGWTLMLCILSAFAPSKGFMPYLMAYCASNCNDELPGMCAKHARTALQVVPRIYKLGRRIDLPSPMELEAIGQGVDVTFRIYFIDGKYTHMKSNSWTSVEEMVEQVCTKLEIKDRRPFSIFEVDRNGRERFLDKDERILDILGAWNYIQREELKRNGGSLTDAVPVAYFVFKVAYFFEVREDDPAALELYFIQARADVLRNRYPCTNACATLLAALQLQEEFGDMPMTEEFRGIDGRLSDYVNSQHFHAEDEDRYASSSSGPGSPGGSRPDAQVLEAEILRIYNKVRGYSQYDCRLSYLDYVKSWRVYGSVFFFVEPQNSKAYPATVIIAINCSNILVIHPETQEYLSVFDISDLISVSYSANNFIIVTSTDDEQQDRRYFQTTQGREINHYVQHYQEMGGFDDDEEDDG